MPERRHFQPVGIYGDVTRVRFTTERGHVVAYTAQYEAWIEEKYRPIVRYDSAHGHPHVDILDWSGKTVEKIWLSHETLGEAFTHALDEIEETWQDLREAFLRRRP